MSTFRGLIALSLLASAAPLAAAPSDRYSIGTVELAMLAQKYFAREQIAGLRNGAVAPPANTDTAWYTGPWSDWSSTCSSTAFRTREVSCHAGTSVVADDQCSEAKPASSDTDSIYSGCGYAWEYRIRNAVPLTDATCDASGGTAKEIVVHSNCRNSSTGAWESSTQCTDLGIPRLADYNTTVPCSAALIYTQFQTGSTGNVMPIHVVDGTPDVATITSLALAICNNYLKTGVNNSRSCYLQAYYRYPNINKTGIQVGVLEVANQPITHPDSTFVRTTYAKATPNPQVALRLDMTGVPGENCPSVGSTTAITCE